MTDDPKTPAQDTPDEGTSDEDTSDEFAYSDRIKDDGPPPPTAPVVSTDEPTTAPPPAEESPLEEDAAPEPPETEVDDAATEPPSDVAAEPVEPRAKWPVVPILAVVTAILFVTTVLFGLMAFAPRLAPIKSGPARLAAEAQENDELEVLARRFAKNFVTLDYRTIDEDLDRMAEDATASFAEQLQRTVDAIGSEFKKRKARSEGEALDAEVLSRESDSALVQVLLRRTNQNVGTKGSPQSGNQIVNVSLVKTSDGWKVSSLTPTPTESS
jgi:Mce-associated membrane protein